SRERVAGGVMGGVPWAVWLIRGSLRDRGTPDPVRAEPVGVRYVEQCQSTYMTLASRTGSTTPPTAVSPSRTWQPSPAEEWRMRLEQLEYLTAVVQHGSLRRASEHLHISQPALSEGVGKLERELGVTLLDRHRTGARINRSGRELLTHMMEVLEAVERLRAAAGDQNGVARTVRVGTVNTGTSSVV